MSEKLSGHVKIVTDLDVLALALTSQIDIAVGEGSVKTVLVSELKVGDRIALTRGGLVLAEVVKEISEELTDDKLAIIQLQKQVAVLEMISSRAQGIQGEMITLEGPAMSDKTKIVTTGGSMIVTPCTLKLVNAEGGEYDEESVNVKVGDILSIHRHSASESFKEEVLSVEPLTEERARIEELELRVKQLENSLQITNESLLQVQHSIVTMTADHIGRLFQDQVMIDTIAARVFVAGANAIHHKVTASKQKAPSLTVVEGYLPGALRAKIDEDGTVTLELEDTTNPGSWVSAGEMRPELVKDEVKAIFGDLLISYKAEIGRHYFIMDEADVDEAREHLSKAAMSVLNGEEPAAPAEEPTPSLH